jgi:hypothetical protein
MRRILSAPTVLVAVLLLVSAPLANTSTWAQALPGAPDQCGPGGARGCLRVPLPDNGSVTFNPNGSYAITMPGHVGSGSAGAGASGGSSTPPTIPTINIDPSLSNFAEEMLNNARHCLTLNGILCEPGTPPPSAFNFVSTRVDIRWLAQQIATDTQRDVLLPGMVLVPNPPEGLVNIPSWFWVDPATYDGQSFSQQVALNEPWTIDWDYWVSQTETVPCPPDAQPGTTCTRTVQTAEHHHEDHLDVVTVTVTLTPTDYAWSFGDDSAADFANVSGIGVPYNADVRCCRSYVEHNYLQSSFHVFDAGGFPVHLTATWNAVGRVHATSDGADALDETLALPVRVGSYDLRYQVRESQPVIVQ